MNTIDLLPHQEDFINSIYTINGDGEIDGNTDFRYVALMTGLGGGKSTIGAVAGLIAADAFQSPGCIIAPDFTTLNDSTLGAARKIWTALGKEFSISWSSKHKRLYLEGQTVYLRSMMYPDQIAGLPDIGWIWIDEASKAKNSEGFKKAIGRLRKTENNNWPMAMWLTGTPNGKDFIYNFFIEEPKEKSSITNRKIFYGIDSSENWHLDDEYIEALATDYDGRYRLQEKGGQFVQMDGAVWEIYESTPIWIESAGKKVFTAPIHITIDFGFRRPCVLFITKLFDSQKKKMVDFIFDYLMPESILIDQLIEEMKNRLINDWGVTDWRTLVFFGDPAGDSSNPYEYKTEIRKIIDAFTPVCDTIPTHLEPIKPHFYASRQKEIRSIEKGIMAVDNFFRKKELAIARSCGKKHPGAYNDAITALSSVRYPELKPRVPIRSYYVKDGENDHAADCLRYWAVFQEPLSKRSAA